MATSSREKTLLSLLKLTILIILVLGLTIAYIVVLSLSQAEDDDDVEVSDENPSKTNLFPCANGNIWKPEDAVLYKGEATKNINSSFEISLMNIEKRFSTIIINCPYNYDEFEIYQFHRFVCALAWLRNNTLTLGISFPPIKAWLRSNEMFGAYQEQNFESCLELANFGNNLVPGTFEGVVFHVEDLFALSENFDLQSSEFRPRSENWHKMKTTFVDNLTKHGLKFGLQVNPVYCYELPTQLPETISQKIDDIFYVEEQPKQLTILNGVPTLTLSDEFKECKEFLGESFPNLNAVNLAVSEKAVVYGAGLRGTYCLKN